MSGRIPTLGYNVTFHVKPEKMQAMWDFLGSVKPLIDDEIDTLQWFPYKCDDTPDRPGPYGLVDTFPHHVGRDDHIHGLVADLLKENREVLFSQPPTIDAIDVIAYKVSKNAAEEGKLSVGGLSYLIAKEDSIEQLKELLTGPYANAIQEEEFTHYWYAFQTNATTFGLFAAWPSEKEHAAHFEGPAFERLKAKVGALTTKPLEPYKATIIAQKTHG